MLFPIDSFWSNSRDWILVSDCYPKLSVAQIGKTVVHMLGRRKWAETSGVTGISLFHPTWQEYASASFTTQVLNLMLSIWCRIFFPTGSVCPGYLPLHPSSFFTDPSLLVLWSFSLTCSVLASLSGHWSTGAQLNHEEVNSTCQIAINQMKWFSKSFVRLQNW